MTEKKKVYICLYTIFKRTNYGNAKNISNNNSLIYSMRMEDLGRQPQDSYYLFSTLYEFWL